MELSTALISAGLLHMLATGRISTVLLIALIVPMVIFAGSLLAGGSDTEPNPPSIACVTNRRTRMLRASTTEREAVVDLLDLHFCCGRLTEFEFVERCNKATRAVTRGDLAALLVDLPHVPPGRQRGYRMHEADNDRPAA